ncbi:potassium/proton antiporter, partial [uncultured Porphyromonas sp.]|uniref:potassium/proton antiporter n=1 Tax=uncultured Porphyromonas sp. TaxID=159274 RepID=UPI00261D03F8
MEQAPLAYEPILLVGSILMLAGIMAGKVGTRFGVPALLLFLITGMIFGSAGLGIQYNDAGHTQFIGMVALTVILFFGGLETKFAEIRPILGPGITLSTLGVLLTTVCFGGFLYGLDQLGLAPVHFTFPIALLLAATMSSTDSASVFALLRSKNMHLKEGLRPILELESGSNDPMAYMLTIALIQYVTGGSEGSAGSILVTFLLQFSVGGLLGYVMGWLTVKLLNKANIGNEALYPILLLCVVFLTFSATTLLQGNGYLAVYIMGVLVGNKRVVHKKSIVTFFDGLTWLLQIALFIILGLFVDAHNLLPIAGFALLAGLFMIFIARPLAVHLCLVFFPSISMRGRWFLSWVGLRGAVPIIFATYPQMSQVEGAETLFHIVFFITLLSLLIQ